MAHAAAAQSGACPSRSGASTSCDTLRCYACSALACAYRTIRLGSARDIQGAYKVSVLYLPWAITSTASKAKEPRPTTQRTSASYHRPRLSKHSPSAISTRNSLLQSRQNSRRFSARSSLVILLTRRFRLQIGQTSHPSCTVSILPRNPCDCNAFTPLCH